MLILILMGRHGNTALASAVFEMAGGWGMESHQGMLEIFRAHAVRYPLMEPRDWYKLIYQSEFGGGHLIADADAARARFLDEWDKAGPASQDEAIEEAVGSGFCRLHLRPARRSGLSAEALFDAFLSGAAFACGSYAGLRRKLLLLEGFLTAEDAVSALYDLRDFVGGIAAEGFPMVSHSAAYRAQYRPSYRIIRAGTLPGR